MADPGPDPDRAMVLSGPVTNLRPGDSGEGGCGGWRGAVQRWRVSTGQ